MTIDPQDSGDAAQALRSAMEQEAIEAALHGHPTGDDELERDVRIEDLEGPDPLEDPGEADSSDDAVYAGGDVTGVEPASELAARTIEQDSESARLSEGAYDEAGTPEGQEA